MDLAAPVFPTADDPLPRLKFSEAQAAMARLEEFRAAEGSLNRRGPKPVDADPQPRANLSSVQADLARLNAPSAVATARPSAATGNLQQDLDQLVARKTQLELEVERWTRESAEMDTRYRALQAELARLESENRARPQLDAARAELAGLDSEIQRAQARMRAAQAEADQRALQAETFRVTEGAVGRRAPQTAGNLPEGAVVKRTKPTEKAMRDLDRLTDSKEKLERDRDDLQKELNLITSKLTLAERTDNAADVARYTKEVSALKYRLENTQTDLARLEDATQSKMRGMTSVVLELLPTTPLADNDSLQVTVSEDDTLTGTYTVKRGGYIVMPRVGRINVNGLDVPGTEKAIKEVLEATQLRQATVIIERTRPEIPGVETPDDPKIGGQAARQDTIFLAGEFVNAGAIRLSEEDKPTLVKTILRSGGLLPAADLTRVRLLRFTEGRGRIEEVNVQAILNGTGAPTDLPLHSGDIIVVPSFAPVVYVTGNVVKPGTLRLFQDEQMTAYSAILRAGGLNRYANMKKIYVVREIGNGEKAKIPVNLKEGQEGRVPDIILQGRDIVVVPESFWSL